MMKHAAVVKGQTLVIIFTRLIQLIVCCEESTFHETFIFPWNMEAAYNVGRGEIMGGVAYTYT